MKNNKAFTLIELLAVIVILAIIALIATPIILGVIENAKKGAAANSALGYIDAVEKEIVRKQINDIIMETGTIDINATDYYKHIVIKGNRPSKGFLNVSEKGVILGATLCIDGYKINYNNSKATIES